MEPPARQESAASVLSPPTCERCRQRHCFLQYSSVIRLFPCFIGKKRRASHSTPDPLSAVQSLKNFQKDISRDASSIARLRSSLKRQRAMHGTWQGQLRLIRQKRFMFAKPSQTPSEATIRRPPLSGILTCGAHERLSQVLFRGSHYITRVATFLLCSS